MQLSLEELKSVAACGDAPLPFRIGTAYLFRTIGYHWLGRVTAMVGKFLTLDEATWVADTGRFNEALSGKIGELSSSELEPSPRPVILNADHVTDAVEYPYQLPRGAK